MDNAEAKILAAQLRRDLPELDLHGFYPDQALEQLGLFLSRLLEKNERASRVIYGGGSGKLRNSVFNYLQQQPFVATIQDEGGSCLILLK